MTLLEIFGVKESYLLPTAIMDKIHSGDITDMVKKMRENGIIDLRDYYQSEQGDRKSLKQDFTPDCICEIVASLTKDGTCLDMCAGTGALAKAVAKKHGTKIHEIEFSQRTIAFNLLDGILNGLEGIVEEGDCLRDTVKSRYLLEKNDDEISAKVDDVQEVGKYDNVVMNPPYSMDFPDTKDYSFYGFEVPKSKADFGFILSGLSHLKDDGRLIAIVPHGLLFRGQKEGDIRKWLIEQKLIKAIIGLPEKLFLNTAIPVFILVLERNSENILVVDASKDFAKSGKNNIMDQTHIDKVLKAFSDFKEVKKFAHVASYEEIKDNDFNLNIPRYVDTYEPEPLPDMKTLLKELEEIRQEERKTMGDLYEMLGDLVGPAEDMAIIDTHRQILLEDMNNES